MVAFAYDSTAARLTLRVTHGKPFRAPVAVTLRPTGEPYPITADEVRAFVTLYPNGDRVLDFTVLPIDGHESGCFMLTASKDEMAKLVEGSYWWEMEHDDDDGSVIPLVEGVFEVVNRGRNP
jgi:hypothetical protein